MQLLKCIQLVCVSLAVLNLIRVSANHDSIKEKRSNFEKNKKLLSEVGKCEPKIRLRSIYDHPDVKIGATYYPLAAVLHVCDETGGCCSQRTHQCKPLEEEEVEIVFLFRRFGERKTHLQKYNFVNHTQCACIDMTESPR